MTNKPHVINMTWMRRLVPLCLVVVGFIVSLGAVGLLIVSQKPQHSTSASLPENVAGFPLIQSTQADKAIAEIERMHGNDFSLSSGAIGMYGSDHMITLWVAGTPTQTLANQMLITMHDRIANSSGSSPFSPVGERRDGTRTVYELEGMGQKHFYFQSKKLVVWLAVGPGSAEAALSQILKFYP